MYRCHIIYRENRIVMLNIAHVYLVRLRKVNITKVVRLHIVTENILPFTYKGLIVPYSLLPFPDYFAALDLQESSESCFGLEKDHQLWMRSTCSASTSIQMVHFTVVFHPASMNCTNNTVNHEPFYTNCCQKDTINEERDCIVEHQFDPQYSMAYYQTCNGKSSCSVMTPQVIVRTYHDQCISDLYEPTPWDTVSNLMYMHFYCIDSRFLHVFYSLKKIMGVHVHMLCNMLLKMNNWHNQMLMLLYGFRFVICAG